MSLRDDIMPDEGWGNEKATLERLERQRKALAAHAEKERRQRIINAKEAAEILAKHAKDNDKHAVVGRRSKVVKLTRTAILDANAETRALWVEAFPLTDINGEKAKVATFDLWKKDGWGHNEPIGDNISKEYLSDSRVNRSYRVGGFSTDCLIIWGVGKTKINP